MTAPGTIEHKETAIALGILFVTGHHRSSASATSRSGG